MQNCTVMFLAQILEDLVPRGTTIVVITKCFESNRSRIEGVPLGVKEGVLLIKQTDDDVYRIVKLEEVIDFELKTAKDRTKEVVVERFK